MPPLPLHDLLQDQRMHILQISCNPITAHILVSNVVISHPQQIPVFVHGRSLPGFAQACQRVSFYSSAAIKSIDGNHGNALVEPEGQLEVSGKHMGHFVTCYQRRPSGRVYPLAENHFAYAPVHFRDQAGRLNSDGRASRVRHRPTGTEFPGLLKSGIHERKLQGARYSYVPRSGLEDKAKPGSRYEYMATFRRRQTPDFTNQCNTLFARLFNYACTLPLFRREMQKNPIVYEFCLHYFASDVSRTNNNATVDFVHETVGDDRL